MTNSKPEKSPVFETYIQSAPSLWLEVELDQIANDVSYGYTAKSTSEKIGPHLLRITDIQDNRVNWFEVPYCEISLDQTKKYSLQSGDLVFARTGATVGKSFLIQGEIPLSVFASYLIRVRFKNGVDPSFFSYFFKSRCYWDQITEFSSGIGQPNVNGTKLKSLKVPLPALPEQQQIAAKLDELLAQVDSIKTRLDAIPKILKRFRQSVLAAAVSGKLTEDWRGLNDLRIDWKEFKLGDVLKIDRGSSPRPIKQYITESDDGVNWIKIGDASDSDKYITSTREKITKEGATKSRHVLPGDFILSNSMSLGRAYIMKIEGYVHDGWFVLRLPGYVNSDFFYYLLSSSSVQDQFTNLAVGGVVQNIRSELVKQALVKIPSLEEQIEIANRVEQFFSYADQIEQRVKDAQAHVNHLTQAILAKAFRGELTADWRAQNPDLINGEALLARINAERKANNINPKRKVHT
jgi:type I restriction enzyme S subunit